MTITYDDVQRLRAAHVEALTTLDTFDLPASHPTYVRKVTAHLAYVLAQAAYTGMDATFLIVLVYGKKVADVRQTKGELASLVRLVTGTENTAETLSRTPTTPHMAGVGTAEGDASAQTGETIGKTTGQKALGENDARLAIYQRNQETQRLDSPCPVSQGKIQAADTALSALVDAKDPSAESAVLGKAPCAPTTALEETSVPQNSFSAAVAQSDSLSLSNTQAGRCIGVVTRYDGTWGTVRTPAHGELYFRRENLRHADMPLKTGDAVTCRIWESTGIVSAQAKAVDILVEGYTPPVKPTYTPNAEIAAEAQQAKIAQRERMAAEKARKAAQQRSAFQGMKRIG